MAGNLQFGEWAWQYASQSPEIQAHLEKEIIGEGWLFRQPAKEQLQVLEGAPKRFIESVVHGLKPEAAIRLGFNPYARQR